MKKLIRVLHLEDDINDAELAQSTLAAEGIVCETVVASSRKEFADALERGEFDLVIADYNLPAFDGLTALAMTREKYPDLPFIFLSGTIGEETAIESLKNGATDYVLKHRLARLAPAVRRALQESKERSAHKRTHEALRKLSMAVEQSPVTIIITDTKGAIEYVNPKFTELTGFSREEAYGQNPRMLKSGSQPPEFYREMWATISAGEIWRGELQNHKKNGDLYWESAFISPLKNDNGEIINYIGIKEDITARKNLENQLNHAQKMEALGTLTSGIAHDFNNILTVIMANSTILDHKMAQDNPLRAKAHNILAAAERAANLTHSLLAFGRKQMIDLRPVILNDIVRNIDKLIIHVLREDIECKLFLTEEALTVFADSGQIDQILLNLASNARDAMPNGGELSISTMAMNVDTDFIKRHGFGTLGSYAVISVTDNGTGMDEMTRLRIFEPFFTTKEVGKGTGLGLSIIYGLVKQHHGFITCFSELGTGTTFNIYLPLHQDKAESKILKNAPQSPAGGTEKILLAEDDEMVRTLTRTILEEAGYHVIEAVNGKNAVQLFMDHRKEVKLLLLDLIMPRMNGSDAYIEIRAVDPRIRVIFTSGYSADIINRQELTTEGLAFLAKPVSPVELLRKVREVLDQQPPLT